MALLLSFMEQTSKYSKDDWIFAILCISPFILYLIIDLIFWYRHDNR